MNVLEGFRRRSGNREVLATAMGTAFSRGDGSHLPPMKTDALSSFITETQADNLRPEVKVELCDDNESDVWEDAAESGLIKVDPPEAGKMVRIQITGQAVVYVGAGGKLVVDNRN